MNYKHKLDVNNIYLDKFIKIFKLLKKSRKFKFDESVDVSIRIDLDIKDNYLDLCGFCMLPNGIGKKNKVGVFNGLLDKDLFYKLGAAYVGMEDFVKFIKTSKKIDLDYIVSDSNSLNLVNEVANILVPKKLMPNLKLGTVSSNLKSAVSNFIKGQVVYRSDKYGIINSSIGRINFKSIDLSENLLFFINYIKNNKPLKFKRNLLIKKIYISSTMSKSFIVNYN